MQVFLSYSGVDREFVDRLRHELVQRAIRAWIDTEDLRGVEDDRWRRGIVKGIRGSSALVLVLSPDSVASAHVERELTVAAELDVRIVPIVCRPCDLPDGFQFDLAGVQRTDFTKAPFDVALDELARRIEAAERARIATLAFGSTPLPPPPPPPPEEAQLSAAVLGAESRPASADAAADRVPGTDTYPLDRTRARRRRSRLVAGIALAGAIALFGGVAFWLTRPGSDPRDAGATTTSAARTTAAATTTAAEPTRTSINTLPPTVTKGPTSPPPLPSEPTSAVPPPGQVGGRDSANGIALAPEPSSGSLRLGHVGERVESLQRQLASLGYNPGSIDGQYGPLTSTAIVAFQDAAGRRTDGIAGPATMASLAEAQFAPTLRRYFDAVVGGDVETAWSMLAPNYRATQDATKSSAFWDHIVYVEVAEFGECFMTDAISASCPMKVRYYVDRGGISLEPVRFSFSSIPTGPLISSYRINGQVVCEEGNDDDPSSCAVR